MQTSRKLFCGKKTQQNRSSFSLVFYPLSTCQRSFSWTIEFRVHEKREMRQQVSLSGLSQSHSQTKSPHTSRFKRFFRWTVYLAWPFWTSFLVFSWFDCGLNQKLCWWKNSANSILPMPNAMEETLYVTFSASTCNKTRLCTVRVSWNQVLCFH